MPQTFTKDPDAGLEYQVNWTTWLNGDTIATSEWIAPSGITVDDDTIFTGGVATIWISGGVAGEVYTLTNRITTAATRINDQSIRVRVREK